MEALSFHSPQVRVGEHRSFGLHMMKEMTHSMRTTDWRKTQWKTHRDNYVAVRGGSARIVWGVHPATDVAYVLPTDGDNGNTNAMLISLAPDIMRCLLLASTCLRDCEQADAVRAFVNQLKSELNIDIAREG